MRPFSILFLLIATSWTLVAQEFHHYDITDGLSSIEVTDIKENENFLWIATCDGLNRFDGVNFKVFKRENGSINCLTENNIETLFFDSNGFLWIGLKTGGVDVYDPHQEQFTHLNQLIDTKTPSRVVSIMEDSQKNIWLGTWEEGIYKLTPTSQDPIKYRAEIRYPGYIVSSIIEKPKGFIRVGTYFGSFVYELDKQQWTDLGHPDKAITQFYDTGEENSLWCSTWSSGLLKIQWEKDHPASMNILQQFSGNDFKSIYRIIGNSPDQFYMGTWGEGLKRVDLNHPDKVASLATDNFNAPLINCLFEDRYHNIWVGTYGGGIFSFSPERNGIRHFPTEGKLPAPAISLAELNKNQFLVGTQGFGIYLCNMEKELLQPVYNNAPNGEFNNYILSLYSDKDFIFAGHDGFGLPFVLRERFPEQDIRFNEFFRQNKLEKVTAVYPSEDGRIWIGTKQSGLISVKVDYRTKQLEDFIQYNSFGRDEITGFVKFDDNHLFISSHNGLFLFNTQINQIEENGKILFNEIVYRIVGDQENKCLWVGTSTKLLRLDFENPEKTYAALPSDMLPQGSIRVLTLDKENNLWFAIGERLFCSIGKEKRVRELNPDLLGNHAILSSTKTNINSQQHLIFGTTDNLILIHPNHVINQSDASKILFTGLGIDHQKISVGEKVYGDVVLHEATEYIKEIKLSYNCRWISLSFAETGWDFFKNKFQYRLKGFSDSWQYLDLANPIIFSHFNPGEYSLEIRKYDSDEKAPISWSMQLTITPPWWKTTWFYLLITLMALIVASVVTFAFINYYKKRHILRLKAIEKQKEEELLKEKESFFTGLSHDLLTPFSLILAPVNDLLRENQLEDNQKEKLEIISKNTTFLSDIFATILDFKRAELSDSQLKETNVEIVSFAHIVCNAFEYLAKSKQISLDFSSNIDNLNILTDNIKIERILYNLLSNAIKFTAAGGTISLRLEYQPMGMLKLIVKDDGCGMEPENQSLIFEKFYREPEKTNRQNPQGLGLGLYIVRKFVTLLQGTIHMDSSPGKGTMIAVPLPIKLNRLDSASNPNKSLTAIDEELSTILIVEDNEQMLEYLRKKMASHFNVITSSNGIDALESIEKSLPEIIITDVIMPEMDGLSLCRHIKENPRYSDLFVIVLSAKTSIEDELKAYKQGADIYIKKPFDSEVLLNQLVNIHTTRQHRKSQLLASLVSKDTVEIEFDSKETFLKRAMQLIDEHIMDADFKIDEFANEMNMSKTVLHRKFKLLLGQTPNQFIRLVRLRKSVSLLKSSDHTIAEIAYLTGFNQSHYFIKCFREVYNETPKSFREKKDTH